MEKKLLEILACPVCKGKLRNDSKSQELTCRPCGIAYPVRDQIPVLLESEARTLTTDERLD